MAGVAPPGFFGVTPGQVSDVYLPLHTSLLLPNPRPAANWFQISLRMLDENYKPVRYQYSGLMMYSNGYPKPPLANQNPGAQGQAAQGR